MNYKDSTNTGNDAEFNRKILAIAAAIVANWKNTIANQTFADTPSDILALMSELSPEHQDRLHAQYELANSGGKDYVEGDFMMGIALIAGGSIEVALKSFTNRTFQFSAKPKSSAPKAVEVQILGECILVLNPEPHPDNEKIKAALMIEKWRVSPNTIERSYVVQGFTQADRNLLRQKLLQAYCESPLLNLGG